jgi:hypothetical protein
VVARAARSPVTDAPRGAAGRVAAVQRQARHTLTLAFVFAIAAPTVAVVPHRTGAWLPLHLFLVGGVLLAISGATQLLAVTWSASPAPAPAAAAAQRWLLAGATAGLAIARESRAPHWLIAMFGGAVVASLAVLAALLVQVRARAVVDRYTPAIDAYLVALAFGVAGSVLGTAIAAGALAGSYSEVRSAHVAANLLGLVGLVIAGTVPYFVATQARVKQSARYSPAALRMVVAWMALASAATAGGLLARRPGVGAAGFFAYAAGIAALTTLLPVLHRKQFDWAGARLAQLLAGIAWWAVGVVLLGVHQLTGHPTEAVAVATLVVGGYAQVLVASLAYFGPVLRGGGHVRLSAGFSTTRSWAGFAAANVAAFGALLDLPVLLGAAVAVWVVDTALRGAALTRVSSATAGPAPAANRDQGP